MSDEIRQLAPKALWNHFADLNAVPRPSKKEERVIEFVKSFGASLNLPTLVDGVGNIIIKKPASKGMEDRQTIVLQSHLDMVHQKNAATNFDFNKQGIDMYIDGDWVKAKGTTLGADNGIGVATIMALLSSDDITHPSIEALFTIDEETGMTGAKGLVSELLDGKILLNLDTEDDDELTIGCAGGIDVSSSGSYKEEKSNGDTSYRITIKGLTGGHSGMDIPKGRGNANKLMNRILLELSKQFAISIAAIDGGSLRNAIPRESVATIVLQNSALEDFKKVFSQLVETIKVEYQSTDERLDIQFEEIEKIKKVLNADFQNIFLKSLESCPNGVYKMTPGIEGLVQTSNNIARVIVNEGKFSVQCLTRSAVDSEKKELTNAIASAFELTGAAISLGGDYPGWVPRPEAPIIKIMSDLYEELFNEKPRVNAVHAGLECGIIGTKYPDMQMISFGPNIYGAHSPDERAQISSVQKFWKYFLETLKRIPVIK